MPKNLREILDKYANLVARCETNKSKETYGEEISQDQALSQILFAVAEAGMSESEIAMIIERVSCPVEKYVDDLAKAIHTEQSKRLGEGER